MSAESMPSMRDPTRTTARALLARAERLIDADPSLLATARQAARSGLGACGHWMAHRHARVRPRRMGLLIATKYALSLLAALVSCVLTAALVASWFESLLLGGGLTFAAAVLGFYAVEVQMAFVVPLAADGCATPFRDSRALVTRAGGTIAALGVILPIATRMLLGPLGRRSSLRAWCAGCLAVDEWYLDLRASER